MRHFIVAAGMAVCLCTGSAWADLRTTALDPVEAEVIARNDALTGDLDKGQKKLRKVYATVLKKFGKDSTSLKKDAKLVKAIVTALAKTHAEDAAMLALLDDGLAAFYGEMTGELVRARRRVDVCGEGTKHRNTAQKALDKAQPSIDEGSAQLDRKKRAKKLLKAQKWTSRATKFADKAIDEEPDLTAHEAAFLRDTAGYQDARSCTECHTDAGTEMLTTGHWKWEGTSVYIDGLETEVHGKNDLLNNFCIAIASNEPRCTQCHPGFGYANGNFDFSDESAIDCLVCHDTTGTYSKDLKTAGLPASTVDLEAVAINVGEPGRKNCGDCHFFAGGGDNVKHGDLASTLLNTTRTHDVHMGTDGGNLSCQECHTTQDHKIAGMPVHSADEGRVDCKDCHEGTVHSSSTLEEHTAKVACQTCHIPTFSRTMPTKMEWYWEDAGQDISPIPTDKYGKPLYDKKKGTFVWGQDVEPTLLWSNGKWERRVIGKSDTFTSQPVVMAAPLGDRFDPDAKIYPFKKMIGTQPADAAENRILVPHLFGLGAGPNPYWGKYDWNSALIEGAAAAGQFYSGAYFFPETVMYLSLNHEIAPKENARSCSDCHDGGIDFTLLGYPGDPRDP